MDILTKEAFQDQKEAFLDRIRSGEVFVYPTDTIYGIGCSALDADAVENIRAIKKRDGKPFSVIAPSKGWIMDNCDLVDHGRWLQRLPGPYTLVCKLKNKRCIAKDAVVGDRDTLGVRLPNHWISAIVTELNTPLITTSVNTSGEPPLTSISAIGQEKQKHINFAIDEGAIEGSPSQIIILTKEEPEILTR